MNEARASRGLQSFKGNYFKKNIQKVCMLIQNVCILADRKTGKT